MSQSASEKWPLSQKAKKPSGECSVCHAVRQLHIGDGTVHRHGPRDNPCPGSDKPPVAVRLFVASTSRQQPSTSAAAASQHSDVTVSPSTSTTATTPPSGFTHPVLSRRTIKHIPKSARPACAKRYAELLRHCTNDPYNLRAWEDLFNLGRDVLTQPTRGGKRHSLASIIKKRTVQPYTASRETHSDQCKKADTAIMLANAVSAKIEEGR